MCMNEWMAPPSPSPCTVVINLWLQKISMLVRKGDDPLSTTFSFITCRQEIRTYTRTRSVALQG